MKSLLLLTAGLGVAAAAWMRPAAESCDVLAGEYLEVRSATVFGGACHINSEDQSSGRQALVAWKFEQGAVAGVALDGVTVVAAISSDDNLGYDAARRSVLYVDSAASSEQQLTVSQWAQAHCAAVLGDVLAVETLRITFERTGDAFRLTSDAFEVVGLALADRSCCTMPDARWYEPLDAKVADSVVGHAATCRFVGTDALPSWIHEDANNAHVARFAWSAEAGPATAGACCEGCVEE